MQQKLIHLSLSPSPFHTSSEDKGRFTPHLLFCHGLYASLSLIPIHLLGTQGLTVQSQWQNQSCLYIMGETLI